MMGATVLAKVLGLVRGMLLAAHYGTTEVTDAFTAAQRIPLSFFDLLFSAAILGCFIPVYNGFFSGDEGLNESDCLEKADGFACIFLNTCILLAGICAVFGMIFAPNLIAVFAPGLDAEGSALAATLLRIMFPMIAFSAATYTMVGILQSKGEFMLPALLSSISNAGVILYFLFVDNALGEGRIYGLAAAYLISWLIQFLTLAIPLAKRGFRFRLLFDFKNPALIRALKMVPPIMLGSWLIPAGSLTATFFASFSEEEGAVSVFEYANNTYIMIAGILTYSICNYLFPKLSRLGEESDAETFYEVARNGIAGALAIVLPMTAAVYCLSGEGIAVLYIRGGFDAVSAMRTAGALQIISIAMGAFALVEFMSRLFYAKKQLFIPAFAAVCGVVCNIAVSALCMFGFSMEANAVAVGNAAGQLAAAAVFVIGTVIRMKGFFNGSFLLQLLKIAAASIFAGAVMFAISVLIGNDPFSASAIQNILCAFAVFVPGAAVYLILFKIFKIKLVFGKGGN